MSACGRSPPRPAEIAKHLDGELTVRPLPATGRERRAEIRGRAKLNSLLAGQEAVCGEVVAGARFPECYTAPTTYWVEVAPPGPSGPFPPGSQGGDTPGALLL
jgi:hypothetical protein